MLHCSGSGRHTHNFHSIFGCKLNKTIAVFDSESKNELPADISIMISNISISGMMNSASEKNITALLQNMIEK